MQLQNIDKSDQLKIAQSMSITAMSHPLFMYYCRDRNKRSNFIFEYFKYYLKMYCDSGCVYASDTGSAVGFSVPIDIYCEKPKGLYAIKTKTDKSFKLIAMHRNIVNGIAEVILPPGRDVRVLTLYGDSAKDFNQLIYIAREAMETARSSGAVLLYETFSKRLVMKLENMGFEIGYQKNFLSTQYCQTLMTFNIE